MGCIRLLQDSLSFCRKSLQSHRDNQLGALASRAATNECSTLHLGGHLIADILDLLPMLCLYFVVLIQKFTEPS